MGGKDTKLKIVVDAENRSQGVFNDLKRNIDTINKSHEGLIYTMSRVGAIGTAAFAGLGFLTKGIIEAGVGFEQTQIAFETMLGSAELGQKTLKELSQFAAQTPFEIPQLETAAKQLLAYGMSAEELIPTLRMLGDITAGVGMDKLPQLILAFGQVKAATKLTGMELRQFTEAGVPMLDALAAHFNKTGKAAATVTNAAGLTEKQITKLGNSNAAAQNKLHGLNITLEKQMNRMREMKREDKDHGATWKNLKIDIEETQRKIAETTATIGQNSSTLNLASQSVTSFGAAAKVTAGDVKKMIEDGKVSFADVQAALGSMTSEGGKFFELMARQSQSLGGLWSTFKDQITLTARSIGEELLPYLKPLVVELIRMVGLVGEFVKEHPKLTAGILAAALGFSLMLAVLLPISIALPGIILMFQGMAALFLFIVSGPGMLMIASILAIGTALLYMQQHGWFTKQAWEEVWVGMKITVAQAANAIISIMEGITNSILSSINFVIRQINKVIGMAQKVPGLGKNLSKFGELDLIKSPRIDEEFVATQALRGFTQAPGSTNIVVTGNTLLDQDAATKLGDMILGRLKLSNAL